MVLSLNSMADRLNLPYFDFYIFCKQEKITMGTRIVLLAIIIFTLLASTALAQRTSDVAGGKDHPLISRFQGSVIEFYKVLKWDSCTLPVSKLEWKDGGKSFPETIDIEGEVTRIQYSVSAEHNASFVFKNYKDALLDAGFTVLFSGYGKTGLGDMIGQWGLYYFGDQHLNMKKFGYAYYPIHSRDSFAYIAAKAVIDGQEIYTAIIIVTDNFWVNGKKSEFTLITQDIIEIEAPETGFVTAQTISEDIESKGHIAIYDIYFDTGKWEIKPESSGAMKSIAEYLNGNSSKKFHIVGHTDNVGSFASNMTLSEKRANAVMNELISKYGVKATQLDAHGISSLSPVMANSTDEGKSKNRRVEIVEQ